MLKGFEHLHGVAPQEEVPVELIDRYAIDSDEEFENETVEQAYCLSNQFNCTIDIGSDDERPHEVEDYD